MIDTLFKSYFPLFKNLFSGLFSGMLSDIRQKHGAKLSYEELHTKFDLGHVVLLIQEIWSYIASAILSEYLFGSAYHFSL